MKNIRYKPRFPLHDDISKYHNKVEEASEQYKNVKDFMKTKFAYFTFFGFFAVYNGSDRIHDSS